MLGKIVNIKLGVGGYQNAMFGISVELGGAGWGVGDFKGMWRERPKGAKWTFEDQTDKFAEVMRWADSLLQDAGKNTLDELVGMPVKVEFTREGTVGERLQSWRILKEVL